MPPARYAANNDEQRAYTVDGFFVGPMVMADEEVIDRRDLADAVAEIPGSSVSDALEVPLGNGFSLQRHLEEIQRDYLRRAMEEAGGVQRRAAELLGYRNYQTLAAQLERLGVR